MLHDLEGSEHQRVARWLLLRYVDRRGGRAVDLEVRVARQGSELCGGLAPVAQQALLGRGQEQHCYDSVLAGKAVSVEDHRLAVNTANVMGGRPSVSSTTATSTPTSWPWRT